MPKKNLDALLLEIQMAAKCAYLSDLCILYRRSDEFMQEKVSSILLERYSIEDWNAAASYITGKECCFQSAEEARDSIAGRR